jgi:hypothetical protein
MTAHAGVLIKKNNFETVNQRPRAFRTSGRGSALHQKEGPSCWSDLLYNTALVAQPPKIEAAALSLPRHSALQSQRRQNGCGERARTIIDCMQPMRIWDLFSFAPPSMRMAPARRSLTASHRF